MSADLSQLELACQAAAQRSAAVARVERAYEASIQHLARLKAEVDGDQRPCRNCRYGSASVYSFNHVCGNPILREGSYNRNTGKITWTNPKWDHWSGVRSESGACGPMGLLFVPANPIVMAYRHHPVRLALVAVFTAILLITVLALAVHP